VRTFLIATIVSLLLASVAAGEPARTPTLRVSAQTVQGRHFYRHEKVRVAFAGDVRTVVRVRTTATGSFVAPLPTAYDPCTETLVITAAGARGDDARLKLPQRACPPQ
jgi:hypothetical protein